MIVLYHLEKKNNNALGFFCFVGVYSVLLLRWRNNGTPAGFFDILTVMASIKPLQKVVWWMTRLHGYFRRWQHRPRAKLVPYFHNSSGCKWVSWVKWCVMGLIYNVLDSPQLPKHEACKGKVIKEKYMNLDLDKQLVKFQLICTNKSNIKQIISICKFFFNHFSLFVFYSLLDLLYFVKIILLRVVRLCQLMFFIWYIIIECLKIQTHNKLNNDI